MENAVKCGDLRNKKNEGTIGNETNRNISSKIIDLM